MKITESYIDEIDRITKSVDQLDGGRLFLAYQQLSAIENIFLTWDVSIDDKTFDRVIKAKGHIELLLTQKLAEYEVLKMRVECYETKA